MRIPIDEISVSPGRREAKKDQVEKLSSSLSEVGLLNPITVDRDYTLIAGLHRLEAAKLLGWTEIECTVNDLSGPQAELAEIDENLIRTDLSVVEQGDYLLRRKVLYEAIHPETRHGGDHTSEKARGAKCTLAPAKSFVDDTAEKLGVNPSTIKRQLQAAKNLTPETKAVIRDSEIKVTKTDALKLSRMEPQRQKEAAELLVSGAIRSLDEYLADNVKNPEQQASSATTLELGKNQTTAESSSEDGTQYGSFAESIADMKNHDKDVSYTPDGFLAEIIAFVRRFKKNLHGSICQSTKQLTPA